MENPIPKHTCNEDGMVVEFKDGQRRNIKSYDELTEDQRHSIVMGSVACSICGQPLFDTMKSKALMGELP